MLDKTSTASVVEPATWIWSKWLKLQDQSQFKNRHFTHYEFIEDEMGRSEIQDDLAKLLYSYHSSSPINTNLLAQLKYRQLASVLTRSGDMRPHDTKTRSGNLVEILACEFAKKLGYDIPILRLQYNPNTTATLKSLKQKRRWEYRVVARLAACEPTARPCTSVGSDSLPYARVQS